MDPSECMAQEKESSVPSSLSFQQRKWTEEDYIPQEERPKNIVHEFNKLDVEKEKSINKKLFKKHFGFQCLIDMQKKMYKTKKIKIKT